MGKTGLIISVRTADHLDYKLISFAIDEVQMTITEEARIFPLKGWSPNKNDGVKKRKQFFSKIIGPGKSLPQESFSAHITK